MKKFLPVVTIIILAISILSCNKEETGLTNSKAAGNWEGRYTTTSTGITTFIHFTIQSNGNLYILDTSGMHGLNGPYDIVGDSLISTPSGTHNVNYRLKAINDVKRFEGKWENLSDPSYYGTLYLDKK